MAQLAYIAQCFRLGHGDCVRGNNGFMAPSSCVSRVPQEHRWTEVGETIAAYPVEQSRVCLLRSRLAWRPENLETKNKCDQTEPRFYEQLRYRKMSMCQTDCREMQGRPRDPVQAQTWEMCLPQKVYTGSSHLLEHSRRLDRADGGLSQERTGYLSCNERVRLGGGRLGTCAQVT